MGGRGDRRRRRSRSRSRDRDRDRYSRDREMDRLGYNNWEHHQRKHGGMRRSRTEWRDGRDRSGERRGPRSRSRSKGRKSRERRRSKSRDKRDRSSKAMERSSKSMERSSFSEMERFDKFEGMSEEEKARLVRAKAEAELLANTEPQSKEPSVDKKEEARQKLKDLISKNKERTKEVKEKEKKPKKDVKEKKDKEKKGKKHKVKEEGDSGQEKVREKRERERERAEREKESDGDWHCGDEHCRFVNFKRNAECKKCRRHSLARLSSGICLHLLRGGQRARRGEVEMTGRYEAQRRHLCHLTKQPWRRMNTPVPHQRWTLVSNLIVRRVVAAEAAGLAAEVDM